MLRFLQAKSDDLYIQLPNALQHLMDVASKKGVSTLLQTFVWPNMGLQFLKKHFMMQSACDMFEDHPHFLHSACGKAFNVEHALSCRYGAFHVFDIMTLEIYSLSFSLKYVPVLGLNPLYKF